MQLCIYYKWILKISNIGQWYQYCVSLNIFITTTTKNIIDSNSNLNSYFLFLSGTRPKVLNANFDDLLSGQGFAGTKEKKGPKTIAEMRKEEMAKEMDPEKLKVKIKHIHKLDIYITYYTLWLWWSVACFMFAVYFMIMSNWLYTVPHMFLVLKGSYYALLRSLDFVLGVY